MDPAWTLAHPRRIESLPLDPPDQTWFEGELDDTEVRPLASVVLGVSAQAAETLLRGTRNDLHAARRADLADTPIEWWTLLENGEAIGRLYLWAADCGALFMPADAPTPTGEGVVQGSWHEDAATGKRLQDTAARLRTAGTAPDSPVHRTRFERRPKRPIPLDRLRAAAARMKKTDG
jgi:hypothetical protein